MNEIEVPTVEQCVREDAIETQDIRELGLGWAWFVHDLRAFLPAWQDMKLASPYPEEPVTQIDADVPFEHISLQAENVDLELDLHSYERPLAEWMRHMPWPPRDPSLSLASGFVQTWGFAPFKVLERIVLLVNKRCDASLGTYPHIFFLSL